MADSPREWLSQRASRSQHANNASGYSVKRDARQSFPRAEEVPRKRDPSSLSNLRELHSHSNLKRSNTITDVSNGMDNLDMKSIPGSEDIQESLKKRHKGSPAPRSPHGGALISQARSHDSLLPQQLRRANQSFPRSPLRRTTSTFPALSNQLSQNRVPAIFDRAPNSEQRTSSELRSDRRDSTDSGSDFQYEQPNTDIAPQPSTRPLAEGQLAAEIKAIFSALVVIEDKCIKVVHAENQHRENPNREVNWQPLTSLHKALLQEHHDFFLASQHPASTEPLRNLANKYAMPARMWKHGIHNFLELLRHSLPKSSEFMDEFIILAYQMIALLYETVPSFKDTWIECLGDLARYRMAIEEHDGHTREIFTTVSMSWYRKASRRNVNIGRLYHHQAILARSQPLLQLSLYARSLTATQPFSSARESIMTLFLPVLSRLDLPGSNAPSLDNRLLRLMAISFTEQHKSYYSKVSAEFLQDLDSYIAKAMSSFKSVGESMAIIMIASLLMFGNQKAPMRLLFVRKDPSSVKSGATPKRAPQLMEREYKEQVSISESCKQELQDEWGLLVSMLVIVLKRRDDQNCLPFIYVIVCFIWALTSVPHGPLYLDEKFPFQLLSEYLNSLLSEKRSGDVKSESTHIELSEDVAMHGMVWARGIFPPRVPPEAENEEDDHPERPITSRARKDRILHLSRDIAAKGLENRKINKRWLAFDRSSLKFSAEQRYAHSPQVSAPEAKKQRSGPVAIAGEHQLPIMGTEEV